MIAFDSSTKNLKGNNFVNVTLLNNFDKLDKYTVITANEIDTLLSSKSQIEKANLFGIYLYMKSFMFPRNLSPEGNDFPDAKDKPTAYWGYIDIMQRDIGTSRETINRCIKEYIKLNLLKKYETGSYIKIENGKEITKNAPNIYVLNNEFSKQEIGWALTKLKQIYHVDVFGEFKRRQPKSKSPPLSDDSS